MSIALLITLIFLGVIFLLLEIFIIPGTTVVGIGGVVLLIFSIWQSYNIFGSLGGNITLISTIILLFILLFYALKSNTWRKISLKTKIDGKVNEFDNENIIIGDYAKTVSRLAPMGKIEYNNTFYEAHTNDAFIDQNTEVEIVNIIDNKIYVKQKTN